MYLQHLMFHSVPLLWRLHMVHHADLDIDVTTGLRFHPIEILISMGIKVAAVAVMGPPVTAVLIFEVILNGTAMLNMEMCICRTPSIEYCGSWWGSYFRDLPCTACRRAPGHDHRACPVPRSKKADEQERDGASEKEKEKEGIINIWIPRISLRLGSSRKAPEL